MLNNTSAASEVQAEPQYKSYQMLNPSSKETTETNLLKGSQNLETDNMHVHQYIQEMPDIIQAVNIDGKA